METKRDLSALPEPLRAKAKELRAHVDALNDLIDALKRPQSDANALFEKTEKARAAAMGSCAVLAREAIALAISDEEFDDMKDPIVRPAPVDTKAGPLVVTKPAGKAYPEVNAPRPVAVAITTSRRPDAERPVSEYAHAYCAQRQKDGCSPLDVIDEAMLRYYPELYNQSRSITLFIEVTGLWMTDATEVTWDLAEATITALEHRNGTLRQLLQGRVLGQVVLRARGLDFYILGLGPNYVIARQAVGHSSAKFELKATARVRFDGVLARDVIELVV